MTLQEMLTDLPYTFTGRKISRNLIIILSATLVVFIVLIVVIILLGIRCGRLNNEHNVAFSQVKAGYFEAVAEFVKNVDTSVNPCDDFYSYSCGGWLKRHTPLLPNHGESINVKRESGEAMEIKWRNILEQPTNDPNIGSAERKMKDFYNLCIHQLGRLNDGGKQFSQEFLRDIKGWYVTQPDSWKANWNLAQSLSIAHTKYQSSQWDGLLFQLGTAPYQGHFNQTYIEVK